LPFGKRVERFLQHVHNYFERVLQAKTTEITEQYRFVVDKFLVNGGLTKEESSALAEKMSSVQSCKIQQLQKQCETALSAWKEKMTWPDPLSIYKQVLTYEVLTAFQLYAFCCFAKIGKDDGGIG